MTKAPSTSIRMFLKAHPTVACENIRFSSLFAAEDVSRGTSPAAKWVEKRMFSQANPTVAYSNRFCPSSRKRENVILIEHASCYDVFKWFIFGVWHHRLEASVFVRPHENKRPAFSKISTLESGFEKMCFWRPFLPDTCGRKAKPENNNPASMEDRCSEDWYFSLW